MFVLITNFHSLDNKGDLGIVLGLMDGLLAKCPTIKFGVVGRDLTERAWWEERGVQFFVRPLALHTQRGLFSGFINKFLAVIFIGEYFISLSLIKFNWWQKLIYWAEEKRKTLEAFSHADLIISKGGSFFREPGYYRNILPIGILGHLHQIRLGLALGKKVKLVGAVNQIEALRLYQTHKIYVNLTPAGSMDKTIFEAMACGTTPLVYNQDLAEVLGDYVVSDLKSETVASGFERVLSVSHNFRDYVVANHSLKTLAEKIFA